PAIRKPLPPPPDFSADTPFLPGETRGDDADDRLPLTNWKIPDEPPIGWGGLPPPPEEIEEESESITWEELPSSPPPSRPARREEPRPPGTAPPPKTPVWREKPAPTPAPRPVVMPGMPEASDFKGILAASSGGRDAVFEAALAALGRRFRSNAIFVVRPDGVAGFSGSGPDVNAAALRDIEIPWTEPSIFLNVRLSRSFYLGPLPPLPRHEPLTVALGGSPAECLVQPVLMRDKAVAFFLADSSGITGATPADLTFARELAGAAAASLAASIRLKKKQVI